jgi:Zn finger protein HypA/HybF involved in hydrogenase expression
MAGKERKHIMGSGGECVCPKCGTRTAHQSGVPCQEQRCPECGAKMLRVGSEHHRLWLRKKRR